MPVTQEMLDKVGITSPEQIENINLCDRLQSSFTLLTQVSGYLEDWCDFPDEISADEIAQVKKRFDEKNDYFKTDFDLIDGLYSVKTELKGTIPKEKFFTAPLDLLRKTMFDSMGSAWNLLYSTVQTIDEHNIIDSAELLNDRKKAFETAASKLDGLLKNTRDGLMGNTPMPQLIQQYFGTPTVH